MATGNLLSQEKQKESPDAAVVASLEANLTSQNAGIQHAEKSWNSGLVAFKMQMDDKMRHFDKGVMTLEANIRQQYHHHHQQQQGAPAFQHPIEQPIKQEGSKKRPSQGGGGKGDKKVKQEQHAYPQVQHQYLPLHPNQPYNQMQMPQHHPQQISASMPHPHAQRITPSPHQAVQPPLQPTPEQYIQQHQLLLKQQQAQREQRARRVEGGMSLLTSFTIEEIEAHLTSLNSEMHLTTCKVKDLVHKLITQLLDDKYSFPFHEPVDVVGLDLADYCEIVKKPMDLGTIKKRVDAQMYTDLETFTTDVNLVFANAIAYNGTRTDVGSMAKQLQETFNRALKHVHKSISALDERRSNLRKDEHCILCGQMRRVFEPIVLYCNGSCGMQKIRKNANYWTDAQRQNHYCQTCHNGLKEGSRIDLPDGTQCTKRSLQKLRNDAIPEEGWVECDKCERWIHQVCALFNGRKNKNAVAYNCPSCHIEDRKQKKQLQPSAEVKQAADLAKCTLSRFLENGVQKHLEREYESMAAEQKVDVDKIEKVLPYTIRVVSNTEKKQMVRDGFYDRYKSQDYPSEFLARSKCILLFQKIEGADVLLFGMYVFEFGKHCPQPNQRRVYISYLDSVQYLRPRSFRTPVYQAILVEYLRYVKMRGFHTAHIWSCPPQKGDDYIFYIHPDNQKTPPAARLAEWYNCVLMKAMKEGIVVHVNNLFNEYFRDPRRDPTCLPYFEGDYVVGEMENVILELKQEKEKRDNREKAALKSMAAKETSGGISPRGNKSGTRSNPGELVEPFVEQDKAMVKLGQAFVNMKSNFFVAYLYSREMVQATEKGELWTEEQEKTALARAKKREAEEDEKLETAAAASEATGDVKGGAQTMHVATFQPIVEGTVSGEVGGAANVPPVGAVADTAPAAPANAPATTTITPAGSVPTTSAPASAPTSVPNSRSTTPTPGAVPTRKRATRAASTAKKNEEVAVKKVPLTINTDLANYKPLYPTFAATPNSNPFSKKSTFGLEEGDSEDETKDEDPTIESEIFDNRQLFLNYCQKNSTQFDQLRRAKMTTMMVLYQLHNPSAAKFMQLCGACYTEINHGYR